MGDIPWPGVPDSLDTRSRQPPQKALESNTLESMVHGQKAAERSKHTPYIALELEVHFGVSREEGNAKKKKETCAAAGRRQGCQDYI